MEVDLEDQHYPNNKIPIEQYTVACSFVVKVKFN